MSDERTMVTKILQIVKLFFLCWTSFE